jgi:hypothetical protein
MGQGLPDFIHRNAQPSIDEKRPELPPVPMR